MRTEAEVFVNEPAFIPNVNIPFENLLRQPAVRKLLAGLGQPVKPGLDHGQVPTATYLRFELGYDRNFFFRPLNPYNSFTWVTAYVGQWNTTETFANQDFRFGGQQKVTPTGTASGANTNGLSLQTISKLRTVPRTSSTSSPTSPSSRPISRPTTTTAASREHHRDHRNAGHLRVPL